MCGIIGFVSGREERAGSLLVEGLKTLEYRGYDSAGVCVQSGLGLEVRKETCNLDEFPALTGSAGLAGRLGIAHTRWATHGGVSKANAHPHLSCDGRVAVVHNGIIENFQQLRGKLAARGHGFASQTDSEAIAHLVEDGLKSGLAPKDAVLSAVGQLKGSFAMLVACEGFPEVLAVKNESPLVLGLGEGINFAASDPLPLARHTRRVVYLDDGEAASITANGVECFRFDGTPLAKTPSEIGWDVEASQKGVFEHFMLKEILEQPASIKAAVARNKGEIAGFAAELAKARGVMFVANGTAYHAAFAAQYLFDKIAGKHVNVVNASEFPYLRSSLHPGAVVVAVSQSGETADVLAALKEAKAKGAKVFSIVNVEGSSISRASERTLLLHAGPEMAVASTKAFTCQLSLLYLLAYAAAGRLHDGVRLLEGASSLVAKSIELNDAKARQLAARLSKATDFYFIGRGVNYPIALEGALKLKEISYAHAEGMPSGELKHGTLALIERNTPVVLLNPSDSAFSESLGNAMETKARGAFVIAVSDKPNEAYDEHFIVPECEEEALYPLVCAVPLQLLAYYSALARGKNPDRPRNLAKSVTVK